MKFQDLMLKFPHFSEKIFHVWTMKVYLSAEKLQDCGKISLMEEITHGFV